MYTDTPRCTLDQFQAIPKTGTVYFVSHAGATTRELYRLYIVINGQLHELPYEKMPAALLVTIQQVQWVALPLEALAVWLVHHWRPGTTTCEFNFVRIA